MRKTELRAFLQARRAERTPADVGLDASLHRRVAGLRREEVAMLAGMSVDYYVRFEQGRDITPSDAVLDAISDVLDLDQVQRRHLYALSRGEVGAILPAQVVRPNAVALLEYLDVPAHITGRGGVSLASTELFDELYTDFPARPANRRYFGDWVFLDPVASELFGDAQWVAIARRTASLMRSATTRWPGDVPLAAVVERLLEQDDRFAEFWSDHDVDTHEAAAGRRLFHHARAGTFELNCDVSRLTDDQWLYVFWPAPQDGDAQAALSTLRTLCPSAPDRLVRTTGERT